MKKILPLVLSVAFLASCSKKDEKNVEKSNAELNQFAATAKIQLLDLTSDIALIKVSGEASKLLQYNASVELTTDGSSTTLNPHNNEAFSFASLVRKTKYKARLTLRQNNEVKIADSLEFTTPSFSLDYMKMYNMNTPDWANLYNINKIVGIEGGEQIFYGAGFNEQTNKAVLTSKNDSTKTYDLTVKTLNDNAISISYPLNIVVGKGYIDFSNFYLKINNTIFRTFSGALNQRLDTATVKMFNRVTILDSSRVTNMSGCRFVQLYGRFMNQSIGVSPRTIQGIPAIPGKIEVEIYQGTQILQLIEVMNGSNQNVCGKGYPANEMEFISGTPQMENMIAFNEIHQIVIRPTLPAGTYMMRVKFTHDNGDIYKTNPIMVVISD
ncbi:hypothetical protein [Chitinophaga silvatica]|uniref:hypothetical protein n=1 Tax=Chitinophaga silvatica TaxID=2282649 RepID=UPI0011C10227|nr:hypothetical protein [Chitinophaga silvatica]